MNTPAPVQQPPTSAWSMYRAIVGIATVCATLIVLVYQSTAARIRDNQERFLKHAIADVLPGAHSTSAVTVGADGCIETRVETSAADATALPAFLGFDAAGERIAAVITADGMGYQDNIRVLYAYSFAQQAIIGLKVLDSKETPGLGDRVETEPGFAANFIQLDATLTADGEELLHPIVTVPQGEKSQPWQIDGITGATITSRAIGKLLNKSAQTWVPILNRTTCASAQRDTPKER